MRLLAWMLALAVLLGGESAVGNEARPSMAAQPSARLALVTFVDRGLERAPTGGPGETYAQASDYGATPWGRRMAAELGARHGLTVVTQWPVLTLGVHCVVYAIGDARSLAAVREELRAEKLVNGVYPMNDFQTMTHDPYRPLQHAAADLELDAAHRYATGRDVRVGVVDTGIDPEHPDLAGQIFLHRDLVSDSNRAVPGEAHGTAVGGVIAARTGNADGIVGVAPAARLVALRACWPSAPDALDAACNTLTLAKAIDTARRLKIRVLNLSLSGPRDALLETLLDGALADGMLVVGAMPPTGAGDDRFPTSVPGIIRVGVSGAPATMNEIFAPGSDVFTTLPHSRYGYISGSSVAAAHVSGVIALMLEVAPRLDAGAIGTALASPSPAASGLSACAALARVDEAVDCGAALSRAAAGDGLSLARH
ncbi:MAG: S8 family serine peptidase [Gammaproteobacteria bacterium]